MPLAALVFAAFALGEARDVDGAGDGYFSRCSGFGLPKGCRNGAKMAPKNATRNDQTTERKKKQKKTKFEPSKISKNVEIPAGNQ